MEEESIIALELGFLAFNIRKNKLWYFLKKNLKKRCSAKLGCRTNRHWLILRIRFAWSTVIYLRRSINCCMNMHGLLGVCWCDERSKRNWRLEVMEPIWSDEIFWNGTVGAFGKLQREANGGLVVVGWRMKIWRRAGEKKVRKTGGRQRVGKWEKIRRIIFGGRGLAVEELREREAICVKKSKE
jgi:hypothetical protein